MRAMGIIFLAFIYLCVCGWIITGRRGFFLPALWCAPLAGLGFSYTYGMEINGLLILICIVMFLFCLMPLLKIVMWNTSDLISHKFIYIFLFIFNACFIFYCIYESQRIGYFYGFQDIKGDISKLITVVTIIFGVIFCNYTTISVMIFFDRIFSKGGEFILLKCRVFKFNGVAFRGRYYIDGINNGKTYHFRVTTRNYFMLRKELNVITKYKKGFLGGFYILKIIQPQNKSKTKRHDARKTFVILFITFIIFILWLVFKFFI